MKQNNDNPPLLVIVGETASGKSALAMELARRFDGELVCADSWTVYEHFEIGTAKPSAEERAEVPHHLLDVADPVAGFSAVEFQKRSFVAIDEIAGRGRLPVMVGGTGLYVDSVLFDYQFLPAPAASVRESLNALSLSELQHRASDAGLDTAGIDMRNKRRIIRLIENDGVKPTKRAMRSNTLVLGIRTDREHLRERVDRRVDAMLQAGLEREAGELSSRYGWEAEPMKGIGYREWQPYFAGTQSLSQTRERIIAATMGLAKRQRTWFKRNNGIQWVSATDPVPEAVDIVTTFLRINR